MDTRENALYLSSFGGSGENGRNCHVIGTPSGLILLDCGVKREIAGGQVGFYPALTPELVARIRAVFLSHCHEDHVAALPLLASLGYTGKIYASEETIRETPKFIKKWARYAAEHGGTLPFDPADAEKLRFAAIGTGEQEAEGIRFFAGRSGHVLGSLWYLFHLEGREIWYTGDMCLSPPSLKVELPARADAAIMNGAYAGRHMRQDAQFETLLKSAEQTLAAGGKVLLPVPAKGRGIDITLYLDKHLPPFKIYAEEAVIKSLKSLASQTAWLRDDFSPALSPRVTVLSTDEARDEARRAKGPAVYITPDGMMSTPLSNAYFDAFKADPLNKVIITGHAAKGTTGAGVLDPAFREAEGIKAAGERVIIKVHLDDDDIETLCRRTGAGKILLFHSDTPATEGIKRRLHELSAEAYTLRYPEKVEL